MRARRLTSYALLGFVWLLCAEVLGFFAGGLLQDRWLMYRDPQVPRAKLVDGLAYEDYLAQRDPVLGWPLPSQLGTSDFEANGSVPSPANAELGQAIPAVSLYGDSYTFARNAGADNGWDVRLSRRLGRRVDNFGVSGYGTDQAYLRFLGNEEDPARVVILGHMSENVSRNLTRYRDFQNGEQWYAFKPRFAVNSNDRLQLVPILDLSPSEYQRFLGLEEPQLVVDHENFHPNGPAGAVRLDFPFSIALLRNVRYWRFANAVRSFLSGVREPAYGQFYDPGHPFHGLDATHGILRAFNRRALSRDQRPLVVLFPSQETTEYFRAAGTWTYEPLVDRLEEDQIDFIDFGEALALRMQGRPLEEAYEGHHFTAEIHDLVADVVYQHIVRDGTP